MVELVIIVAGFVAERLLSKLLVAFLKKTDEKDLQINCDSKVRLHKSTMYCGVIFCFIAIFFGSPIIFADNAAEKIEGALGLTIVGIPLGIVPVILYLNIKFEYDSYRFSYRNVFRRSYAYNYRQIFRLTEKLYGLKLEMDDMKVIYVFKAYNGSEKFINKIKKNTEG